MTYGSSVEIARHISSTNMRETARKRKGASSTSHLPPRLWPLVSRADGGRRSEGSAFRMSHVPDRPGRGVLREEIPGDEECLRHLLAMQRREEGAGEGSYGEVYGGIRRYESMCLRGSSASGEDMSPAVGGHGVRSSGFHSDRNSGRNMATARPGRSSSKQNDSGLIEPTVHRQRQRQHRNTQTAPSLQRPSPPEDQRTEGRHLTQRPTTRGTWPAPDGHHVAGAPITDGPWASTQAWASVLGSPVAASDTYTGTDADTVTDTDVDIDGSGDDVYDGWGDYYFDEENFRGRDGGCGKDKGGVCMGAGDGCGGPSIINEFI